MGLGTGDLRPARKPPIADADNSFENVELIEGGSVPAASISQTELAVPQRKRVANSTWFNLDNGAGTTIDDVILKASVALTVLAARIIYVDATTGTVAAGNARIGTTLGGSEIATNVAYANAAAVGAETAFAIAAGAVAAGGAVFVRHTGVAAVAAGQAIVEVEYTFD